MLGTTGGAIFGDVHRSNFHCIIPYASCEFLVKVLNKGNKGQLIGTFILLTNADLWAHLVPEPGGIVGTLPGRDPPRWGVPVPPNWRSSVWQTLTF